MSAFVVSKAHIDAIVSTANAWRTPASGHSSRMHSFTMKPVELGRMLWTENVRSVGYRYPEPTFAVNAAMAETYHWYTKAPVLSIAQAIKAAQCLEYQSCEHPDWPQSDACRFLEQFTREAISRLPDYAEAEWEIQ